MGTELESVTSNAPSREQLISDPQYSALQMVMKSEVLPKPLNMEGYL